MADTPLPPVPDIVRSAYATLVVTDLAEARRFWVALLGFVVTCEDSSALYLRGYDELTHHNLILRSGPTAAAGPLGFRVRSPADLDRAEACDILGSLHAQDHIERGPGRHGVSNAFYVYLRDPDGHRMEVYTSDYYTGDPDHPDLRWPVHDPRRRDYWGNPVIPSWYTGASPVLDLDGKIRPVTDIGQQAESAVQVGADGFTAPA